MSIAWNVAQPYLPIAEHWKSLVAFLSLCFLVLAITGWVFAHWTVLEKVRRAKGARKKMALVIVAIIGAASFVLLWLLVNKPATETPSSPPITTTEPPATTPAKQIPGSSPSSPTAPAPAIQRHINTFSPKEIREQLAQTGPLEVEDVATGFLNGTVDWTLMFSAVHKTGRDELQVQFVPEGGPPPIINCWVALKGNEYLGRLKSAVPFRVKGVTKHVELNIINLSEAIIEQLPPLVQSPTPSPSPPSREEGPKVVPPRKPAAETDAGPRVVPPKKGGDWEKEIRERAATAIQTAESRAQKVNDFMEKYGPLLEQISAGKQPASREQEIPHLTEIEDTLIQECLGIEKETGWIAFRDLGHYMGGLNSNISDFNKIPSAHLKNDILGWTKDNIPRVVADATKQAARPL